MESCELFRLIPREKLDYLFAHSTAGAELDHSFLGFESVYKDVLSYVPKDKTIIDLGCAYATQSWFFRDHAKYIGVDGWMDNDSVIHTENSEYYFMRIQEFIKDVFPVLGLTLDNVFAICSYVPDEEARNLVIDTFPNCRVYYPKTISYTSHNFSGSDGMDIKELLGYDQTFRYRLLSRMQSDCEYYLGNGGRYAGHLWANEEKEHITYMKALWNSFPEGKKPEWLSMEKILDYEKQMIPNGPMFIFDDELVVATKNHEAIDGYIWATKDIVDRVKELARDDLSDQELATMDNVNFYPRWNLQYDTVSVICSFYYHIGGSVTPSSERQFSLQVPLSDAETKELKSAMESYCSKTYGMHCLGFVNEARTQTGLPALDPPHYPSSISSLSSEQKDVIDNQVSTMFTNISSNPNVKLPLDDQIKNAAGVQSVDQQSYRESSYELDGR